MEDSLRELFVHEKPVLTLVKLKSRRTENYTREISTAIDCSYSHTVRIINRLEDADLVVSETKGRKKMLKLTEKGEELAEKAHEFVAELDSINREQGGA